MDVNEIQIGGEHYRKEYQHWDFAIDTNMPYLLGCATKYPTRWLDKNGVQDLRKSIHYLSKAQDRGITMPSHDKCHVEVFCKQLREPDAEVVRAICANEFNKAKELMEEMITEVECGPGPNYVDPDKNYIRG
jgi:hypothetical protein